MKDKKQTGFETTFNHKNFTGICDLLAAKDKDLKNIITQYSYPPLWKREPNFATLIHVILEQQVSLASAKAAFIKLEEKVRIISPKNILLLDDEEMKACYFSRQKIKYARHLAETVLSGGLAFEKLGKLNDDAVRSQLKKIKGIGDWTADVYLMFALNRCDCFPHGDIALIKTIKELKQLDADTAVEKIISIAEKWRPYRTVASYILWHHYLSKRNRL